ncbi:MAG: hypothetical protein O2791_05115, partial [Bacteroidetes bacterium]|nr:hypothetical protein [Bacteroidota bacterium]
MGLDEEGCAGGEETVGQGGAAGGVAGAFVEGGAVGGEDAVGGAGSGALEGDEVGALADEARGRDGGGGRGEGAGAVEGAAEVLDRAVRAVLPNHVHR